MTDVITRPSAASGHDVEGDVRTRDVGDHASAVVSRPSAGVPASVRFDPTRGRESNAAYRFDPTRGRESNAALLFDPTRGRGEVEASLLQLDLARWARTKGLSAASA